MSFQVSNNTLKHRFEIETGARTSFLNYREGEKAIVFTHTEVPTALNGRGIGTALVKAGLDYASSKGLKVVPQCPFVADFIQMHPQYQSLVEASVQG